MSPARESSFFDPAYYRSPGPCVGPGKRGLCFVLVVGFYCYWRRIITVERKIQNLVVEAKFWRWRTLYQSSGLLRDLGKLSQFRSWDREDFVVSLLIRKRNLFILWRVFILFSSNPKSAIFSLRSFVEELLLSSWYILTIDIFCLKPKDPRFSELKCFVFIDRSILSPAVLLFFSLSLRTKATKNRNTTNAWSEGYCCWVVVCCWGRRRSCLFCDYISVFVLHFCIFIILIWVWFCQKKDRNHTLLRTLEKERNNG